MKQIIASLFFIVSIAFCIVVVRWRTTDKVDGTPLMCDREEIDLGEIPDSGRFTAECRIRNTADHPVTVLSVRSGCGCMVAGIVEKSRVMEPGAIRLLSVTVDTRGMHGTFKKSVWVNYVDGHDNIRILRLFGTGKVLRTLSVTPRALAFGTVGYGNVYRKQVKLRSDLCPDFSVQDITLTPHAGAFVEPEQLSQQMILSIRESIEGGQNVVFIFTPQPGLRAGAADCEIRLDKCETETAKVLLTWDIETPIRIKPRAVALYESTDSMLEVTCARGQLPTYSVNTDITGGTVVLIQSEPTKHVWQFTIADERKAQDVVSGFVNFVFEGDSYPDLRVPVIVTY